MTITIPNAGIVLLIGASNSGKTTLLNNWIEEKVILPSEVISSDTYRSIVGDTDFIQWTGRPKDEADCLYDAYNALSNESFTIIEQIIEARCRLNKLTFVDATNLHTKDRKKYINLAKKQHVPITAIILDIAQDLLIKRDEERENPRGKKRVKQHYQTLIREKRLIKKEGFKFVFSIESNEDIELVRKQPSFLVDVGHGIDLIGDIHGCFDEFITLLTQLGYIEDVDGYYIHPEGRKFMSVGDVMSRGPESLKTLLFFQRHVEEELAYMTDSNHGWKIARWLEGRNVTLNHGDEKVAEELLNYEKLHGVDKTLEIKEQLKTFLLRAPSHYILVKNGVQTAVCTHAGIKDKFIGKHSSTIQDYCRYGATEGTDETGKPLRKDWFVHHKGSMLIIWGHDPKPQPLVINNTINIDQGVVFGGKLTAFKYPERRFVSVNAAKDYSGSLNNPLKEWEKQRFAAPNIEKFINGYAVQTEQVGTIRVHKDVVKSAIDTMSHHAIPIEQLVYIPPTMSPTPEPSALPDFLEHPNEAINYYRKHGINTMIAEKKHMGSRAVLLLFKDREVAKNTIDAAIDGVIYSRTGRRFFDKTVESEVVGKLQKELHQKGYFEQYETDFVLLDAEIMPWNLKAKELISKQYAHVSENALLDRQKLFDQLNTTKQQDVRDWLTEYEEKLTNAKTFKDVFQKYCWDVEETNAIQIAPFHVLAHSNETFFHKPHTWHMEMNQEFAKDSSLFVTTEYKIISDVESELDAIAWWEDMTKEGHEGIVIKPEVYLSTYKGKLVQPAIKVRGQKYLNIIYGMDYLQPANLERLKKRNVGKKQKLALKEFALGIEGITRFVRKESSERIHECVLATLAMESDPVDPRL